MNRPITIYAIRNKQTGRRYVGQTGGRLCKRRCDHLSLLRHGKHPSQEMQADFTARGEGAFETVVLRKTPNQRLADSAESEFILEGNCYNHNSGGRSGFTVFESTRKKMSATLRKMRMRLSVLTERDVFFIRFVADYSKHGSVASTARHFGVRPSYITDLKGGVNWPDIHRLSFNRQEVASEYPAIEARARKRNAPGFYPAK
jgi:hypothetical protein